VQRALTLVRTRARTVSKCRARSVCVARVARGDAHVIAPQCHADRRCCCGEEPRHGPPVAYRGGEQQTAAS